MAHTANRTGRDAARGIRCLLLLSLALWTAACTTPEIIRETPQPSTTATSTLVPVEVTVAPTGTPTIETASRRIEQIVLATQVSDSGEPIDARSAIPESAEMFYLCVQVRRVTQGSRFQAIWFEGSDILGRSEKRALEDASSPVWIALQYRPIAKLNPAREHAVELFIDDERIDRLVFRVGVGDPAGAVAAAAFTSGFDALGKPIDPQTYFKVDTPRLTLRVRISNQVDPTSMLFTTLWYREDTQIGQRGPDAQGPDPRRLDFTLTPSIPLPPGNYRVALLLNGAEVRSVPFVMTDGEIPTPTPMPTPGPPGRPARTPVSGTATPAP